MRLPAFNMDYLKPSKNNKATSVGDDQSMYTVIKFAKGVSFQEYVTAGYKFSAPDNFNNRNRVLNNCQRN